MYSQKNSQNAPLGHDSNRLPYYQIPLQDSFDHYRSYIKIELGISESTVRCYITWLNNFRKWLEAGGHQPLTLALFNQTVLTSYLHHHHGKGLRPRSIHSVFHPLRSFGDFLVLRLGLPENYAKMIQLPKKDAAIRLTLTDEEAMMLVVATSRIRNNKRSKLCTAVVSLLIHSGLRRSEILALQVQDVSFSDSSITVRSGKGSKSRRVFPHPDCLSAILDWINVRDSDVEALFVGGGGKGIGHQALSSILEEVKCIAGLRGQSRICIHAMRHNCATRLLRNGADIGQIKQFLGHSSIQTTEIYLHTGEEDIRGIAYKTGLGTPPRKPIQEPPVLSQAQGDAAYTSSRMRSSMHLRRTRRS